jgi:hypothetical protein
MKTNTVLTLDVSSKVSEDERLAIQKIQNWVKLVCRNKCIDSSRIFVSPYTYENHLGETIHKTVICISDNLPNGPVIQIPKALKEISLEDLLSCYKLINFCSQK